MKIFLLTHEREIRRTSNTGAIAIEHANHIVERILWERLKPNKDLIQRLENNHALLLYSKNELPAVEFLSEQSTEEPTELSTELSSLVSKARINDYENIIIIDSTWQEARKIFNQSAYLKAAPQFTLKAKNDSLYKLRANQPSGGLCTIECIIEVLKLKGQSEIAHKLFLKFDQFNR